MKPDLRPLIKQLEDLHAEMLNLVRDNHAVLDQIPPGNRTSAANLLHYLALRRHDVRELQEQLAALGLSSLGRTEPHVLNTLQTVLGVLRSLQDRRPLTKEDSACDRDEGRRLLARNTHNLLGPPPQDRTVRIMVTMPSEAATNYDLVLELVRSGMNCMRINCAHDDESAWSAMIHNLRRAEEETGSACKILMDLAGPKLRTGPVKPGPAVVKYRPRRDALGHVERPARIWLTPLRRPATPASTPDCCLPVAERWLAGQKPGDTIRFTDSRGAHRSMKITEATGTSRWAESDRTSYVASGTVLMAADKGNSQIQRRASVGKLPAQPQAILLRTGDTLILTRSLQPGIPARRNRSQTILQPARIGVTLPEFFHSVKPDQPIWLDDGKIGGIIRRVDPDKVAVEITQTGPGGSKLGAEKGINLPETDLQVDSLTAEDLGTLAFVVKNADMLGYSFVRTAEGVRLLQSHLATLGSPGTGIILKIETRQAFDNLPSLLLSALSSSTVGVMIARGDLAIECGYQRLAEAQEEILWISEAAHVPVIWATQVLESLAKTGTPSRSEITDAAMGERAECVMLNKGPYVVQAVQTLDNILRRMQDHQEKKSSMLRKLSVAEGFESAPPDARATMWP